MFIANLRTAYADLINMIDVVKDCATGDDDLAKLDHWLDCAVDSDTVFENRLAIIRAIYPEYKYNPHSLFTDMAPEHD